MDNSQLKSFSYLKNLYYVYTFHDMKDYPNFLPEGFPNSHFRPRWLIITADAALFLVLHFHGLAFSAADQFIF